MPDDERDRHDNLPPPDGGGVLEEATRLVAEIDSWAAGPRPQDDDGWPALLRLRDALVRTEATWRLVLEAAVRDPVLRAAVTVGRREDDRFGALAAAALTLSRARGEAIARSAEELMLRPASAAACDPPILGKLTGARFHRWRKPTKLGDRCACGERVADAAIVAAMK